MARAQQALERNAPRGGGGGARNQEGTRQAQQKAQALQRRGTRASHSPSGQPSGRAVRNAEWDQNADQQRAEFKRDGHGPTAGGKALRRTSERADPGKLIRDTVGAMQGPKVVRATGNIWDDPHYGPMANEHGAEFAMRARNLDQKINSASQYRQMLDEGREARYAEEARRRDDERDKAAFQQEMSAAGTPQQIEQTFGAGAKRNPDGSISRPGGGAYDATDETGAYTGARSGAPEEQLMPSQVPPTDKESMQSQQRHEMQMQGIKSITEALSAELGKDYHDDATKQRIKGLQEQLNELIGQPGGEQSGGNESVKGPDGNEYKIGDKLPNGKTLTGINPDGTVEVE